MDINDAQQIIDDLSPRLTKARKQRIADVVNGRSNSLIPVVEDIYDTGNINACMRSAEAFGCLDFHIISTSPSSSFKKGKRTSSGATKWLKRQSWSNSQDFIDEMKKNKIQIVATTLSDAVNIDQVDFTQPTAIVFGNEHDGLSKTMLDGANVKAKIPMSGFVESFNISVACALSLFAATSQRGQKHADLSEDEKIVLTAEYYQKSIPKRS